MSYKNFTHTTGELLIVSHQAEIYYEIIGKKGAPYIVMLHGGFGSVNDFEGFTSILCENYQLVGIDFRGQGRSSLGNVTQLNYPMYMRDVENVLVKLGIDHAGFIGFSDGATTGYHLANSKVVKMDWLISIGGTWCYNDTLNTDNLTPIQCQSLYPELYRMYMRVNPNKDFDTIAGLLVSMWRDGSIENLPLDMVDKIDCPVFVVCGENDPAFLPESALILSRRIQDSNLFIVPFIGHDAFNAPKNLFLQGILSFLERV
ncbi:alpha/beta hydrolase [Myroides marinus]|uniref:Alpha/beta hydrolase n=1 Tax=Myroides marinus TaxID=703342 RepID=A0A163UI82_9FLAO|nr:alpha/beta hydrolase [Myroides marinus]KZE73357.1 alpha/beta hydrolase [Myroides marinus]